jgi:hypothetical protein
MWISNFTHPSTIVVLLLEAALFGMALAAASGRLVRPVRWLARGMAAVTLVLGLGFAAGMILELWMFPLPLVRPEAPLGTYADMTQLGLLVGALHLGIVALGSALAFRWPRPGGLLLVLAGVYGVLDSFRTLVQDSTLPFDSFVFGLLLTLLVLAVGALLLSTWRAENGATAGGPSTSTTRRFPDTSSCPQSFTSLTQ